MLETNLGEISFIRTGKLDANAQDIGGSYPFFTCGEENLRINEYAFDTEAILLAGNGNFSVKYYKGKFNAYQRTYVIEPNHVYGKWLYFLVEHHIAQITKGARGSTIKYLRIGDITDCKVSLISYQHQKRICEKIEELFSELDQGIDNLKTAQAQLKVYRQALLKHAFEGKLTAEWRAQNADKLESATALQLRIQHAREQRYQQQLAEWQANGKQGSKPKAPKPITPLTAEELADLPELPEGWGWMKFDQVVNIDSNLVNPNDFGSYPHIAPDNIERETGRLLPYRTIAEDEVTSPKHRFYNGQIIYSKIRPYLSKLIIAQFDGLCSADMYPLSTSLNTKFLFYLMLTKYFVSKASNSGSRTILPKINQQEIGIIALPVCSLKEQTEIVGQLESSLTEIEQLDQTITTSLQQAEALRQSILKKAFSGELVPQDPNDEPATALLARIQAEKGKRDVRRQ